MTNKNRCGGIFNTGQCVVTKEEAKKFNLRVKSKRVICVNLVNEYGECNLILKKYER